MTVPIHYLLTATLILAELATVIRVLLRRHRQPVSRLAWVIVVLVAPLVGMLAYLLFGEARVSLKRWQSGRKIDREIPRPAIDQDVIDRLSGSCGDAAFALAATINRLGPTAGNSATLAKNSNCAIDMMVADIDAACETVHGCFYIWLDDHNGVKAKEAFIRAARRGVEVRLLADSLGSRGLIRSPHWGDLKDAGVDSRVALPVGNLALRMISGRLDVRNHRKLMIVDDRIAWCGSQNIADPEFRIKPRYAPWVDVMTRWEGPVAHDCQTLFSADWMGENGDDLTSLLRRAPALGRGTIIAQVLGTGPTLRFDAMPTMFAELIHSAREELVITSPYFVPDEQLLFALTAAARRGVRTILALPRKNDSRLVAAVSRSYYHDLADAGVEIMEYGCGLLHAKTMVVDRKVALVGSANLDRRSFELNFENNILFADPAFAAVLRARQDDYLRDCKRVSHSEIAAFSLPQRIAQNFLAMVSPLL